MCTSQPTDQHVNDRLDNDPRNLYHEHHRGLEPESYTSEKLRNSTAHHLHITHQRFFIGPIPEGWLQSHRKSWYKTRLRFKNYSSRTVSFAADPVVEHYKQNRSDEAEPSSPAPGQGIPVTDGTTSEQTDGQQEDESTDHETLSSSGDLQTMTYPLTEAEEAPQSPGTNTARRLKSNQSHASRASANTRQGASSSYFTAREYNPDDPDAGQRPASEGAPEQQPRNPSQSLKLASLQGLSQQSSTPSTSEPESTQELLKRRKRPQPKPQRSDFTSGTLDQQEPQGEESGGTEGANNGRPARTRFVRNKAAKYNLDDNLLDKRQRLGARVARAHGGISAIRPRRRKAQEGEIVKAERMLVRVEVTMQRDLPEDYTENDSLRMESRLVDNWREFLMVCRKISDEHAPFALQMYRTRVIPEAEKPGTRTKPRYEIQLSRKGARANLYSSLDKSLVIWGPCKAGTNIYIVRPKSSAHATEWYTFISQVLGWSRPSSLQINVPDLGVSLIFKNPFGKTPNFESEDSGEEESGLFSQAAPDEYAATAIIRGCLEMLENRAEWSEVLKEWSKTERMGLAWKRYDRLEWIFGANEKKMYGSIAMATSHELELRPRRHYPTGLKHEGTKLEEPQPVEGFLVRLTSQRGVHQRMNMVFFKRLYFFTQNHYLLFSRPAKCIPPAPPKMAMEENVPSARELLNRMPISYNIDPYPIQDGEVSWLTNGNKAFIKKQDEYAYMQVRRNIHNLTQADGYIDLCRVREVRQVQRGSSPADANIQEGSDVEFNNDSRDTRRDDGTTGQFDDDRTFEMALDNGLVVRLQSYDKDTRDEWIKRLGALVEYWRARCAADAAELKATRQRNVDLLEIDEEMESMVGQFARKWEVKRAEASPHLHNMCNLLGCRTIKMSGNLFRKPRRHSTFKRCSVILTAGKLLVFRSSVRQRNGVEIPHIHQELETTIDLENCYIYSGLLTDSDLLYANQTFDSNRPGHHALPRAYLSTDVYTTCDEDTAISFVIWQPLQKNFFRARERSEQGETKRTLRHVPKLGVHGRTMVFKARSRVEKDRWVLSISSEIDRLQESKQEDIRIVTP